MAVAELIDLMDQHAGKTDAELLTLCNEWHSENVPCPARSCRMKLDELLLLERAKAALLKGIIDDTIYARVEGWYALTEFNEPIDFTASPLFINDLISTLESLGVIKPPEPTWLLDLGRKQHTIGRMATGRDVSLEHVEKARELKPLRDKISSRRDAVEAQYAADHAELNAAYGEMEKQADDGSFVADPKYAPAWESDVITDAKVEK